MTEHYDSKTPRENPLDLSALDPATGDSGYWDRFHDGVMFRAVGPLARRRLEIPPTMSSLIVRWGRALVPLAAAAGAVAGVLMLQDRERVHEPMTLEEMVAQAAAEEVGSQPSFRRGSESNVAILVEW